MVLELGYQTQRTESYAGNSAQQTDKTSESITEIVNEYAAYLSTSPTTADELAKGKHRKH